MLKGTVQGNACEKVRVLLSKDMHKTESISRRGSPRGPLLMCVVCHDSAAGHMTSATCLKLHYAAAYGMRCCDVFACSRDAGQDADLVYVPRDDVCGDEVHPEPVVTVAQVRHCCLHANTSTL